MKCVFTFNEINYGRIEIDASNKPDNCEIIEKILEGKADYNDTDFTDFSLIEVDGKAVAKETKETEHSGDVDKATAWNGYLRYLKGWANTHRESEFYGITPACFDEWYNNEYREEQANDSYMCCLHDTPRTLDWCENNCDRYYSCDTVALASDEQNEDKDNEGTDSPGSFKVTITETLQKTVTVDAESLDEAEQTVSDNWYIGEYILDAENFVGVEFKAVLVDKLAA